MAPAIICRAPCIVHGVCGFALSLAVFAGLVGVAGGGGWGTDCNGATAGSVCGMMLGADALPGKWVDVFNDRLLSAVREYSECKISDLAKRSYQIAGKVMATAK